MCGSRNQLRTRVNKNGYLTKWIGGFFDSYNTQEQSTDQHHESRERWQCQLALNTNSWYYRSQARPCRHGPPASSQNHQLDHRNQWSWASRPERRTDWWELENIGGVGRFGCWSVLNLSDTSKILQAKYSIEQEERDQVAIIDETTSWSTRWDSVLVITKEWMKNASVLIHNGMLIID